MHYYKKNLGDYYTKAGRLSMLQHGAYTLLMDACYNREVFPTEEEAIEWCWAFTEEEIQAVKFVLKRFFALQDDGTYVQQRIVDEINEYRAMADKNQKIAIEREAKKRDSRKKVFSSGERNDTSCSENVNETLLNQDDTCDNVNNECTSEARPVHESCTLDHLTNNHKPITNINNPPTPQKGKKFDASLIHLPDWLDRGIWTTWVEDRKQRKKPITERAASLQIKQLADYRQQGYSPHDVIQNSIAGGYQGLFPPKQKTQAQQRQDWGKSMTAFCEATLRGTSALPTEPLQPKMELIDATSK